eukprot:12977606-Alexandrium_andersonii.AAC.1
MLQLRAGTSQQRKTGLSILKQAVAMMKQAAWHRWQGDVQLCLAMVSGWACWGAVVRVVVL